MDLYQYWVEINLSVNFASACYTERSILKRLGYGSQSTGIQTSQTRAVENIVFGNNQYV